MEFIPNGVCSRAIHVELDGDTIKNVEFVGGCNGNTQGIAGLVLYIMNWLLENVIYCFAWVKSIL